ncbi:MAG: hypothetical protein F6K24_36395 [Okeania sp. SIO2D1]|nr:hypothetical protein [Okeania sp. SIO2D1]
MPYTTEQLIEILEQELRANWKGERVLLSWQERINNPVVSKALDPHKVSKVFAYRDFRSQIHQYQQEHLVSGIIWHKSNFRGQSLRFPEVHNQLIAIPGDKEILMSAKESVLAFWQQVTKGLNFWLAGKEHKKLTPESLQELTQQAQWAEVNAARTEIYLGLCWGEPGKHHYQWALPHSGCHQIIATVNQPSAIKI